MALYGLGGGGLENLSYVAFLVVTPQKRKSLAHSSRHAASAGQFEGEGVHFAGKTTLLLLPAFRILLFMCLRPFWDFASPRETHAIRYGVRLYLYTYVYGIFDAKNEITLETIRINYVH